MKLTVAAENPLERAALALGIPPVALMDTHLSFLRARAIMVATRLGVFDALASAPATADAVAARCSTSPRATAKLLNALVGSGYLRFAADSYRLAPIARKWLTRDSPHSIRDKVLFEFVEWSIVERVEEYVRDGRPVEIHASESDEQWGLYQRAMRALTAIAAPEIVRRVPVPSGATRLLDIGGSHGYLSVAMCRRHAGLSAVVLDLPAAVRHAAPILAREGMGSRVVHRPGDARTDDLGAEAWDVVFVSLLVHHFDEATNRELVRRITRALRPGGICVVLEIVRPASPNEAGQVGALLDLYYALTSESGTWSIEEMSGWQRGAGLTPRKTIRLRTTPGGAAIVARR
ncbi:MAG TPA: class I SAM-dependent methyltransferase [Vicinamibacterales bacterium]|nr:class I SAM-dependent methyltransferase [Vicinamibacterales bacterium]